MIRLTFVASTFALTPSRASTTSKSHCLTASISAVLPCHNTEEITTFAIIIVCYFFDIHLLNLVKYNIFNVKGIDFLDGLQKQNSRNSRTLASLLCIFNS